MGKKYALFILIMLVAAAVSLLPPQLHRLFFLSIDNVDNNAVVKIISFGVMVALCSFLSTGISIYAREWLRCEIESYLRKNVLSALCNTTLSQLETINRGEWIACTSGDLIETEDFLTASFPGQIKDFFMFLGSCALFLYYGGIFGAILLALAFALIFLNITMQKKIEPALDEIRSLHSEVYQRLLENFEGLRTIRSFNGEALVRNNFKNKLDEINHKSLKTMRFFSSLIGTNELAILLGITVVFALILFKLKAGSITFDDAIVYPFYMGVFFMSVASFYRSNFDWTRFFTKGARLERLIHNFDASSKRKIEDDSQHGLCSAMTFKNIELRHIGHHMLVAPFDLSTKPREILGIIGPSGSGKSTLLEFLAGLRPLVVNGKPKLLSTLKTAYVEQKPYIFEGTLKENLAFGCNINVLETAMWEALKKCRLDVFFQAKNGLSFHIQERGQNLSEGEKYRLGIARAILTNKSFLLMDEPFAALDNVSINAIVKLIEIERKDRGIVIVTHYFPPHLKFDNILNLGRLMEDFLETKQSFSNGLNETAICALENNC